MATNDSVTAAAPSSSDKVDNIATGKWSQEGVIVAGQGGKGKGPDQLGHPHGLFIDSQDSLYICDSENYRVLKIEKIGSGKTTTTVVAGQKEGQLDILESICVDKEGTMYILDRSIDGKRNRCIRWRRGDTSGKVIITSSSPMKNIILDKEEEFLYISSDFSIFQYTTKGKHGKVVAGGDVGQTVSDGVIPRVMQWAAEHVGGADHGHAQLSEQLFETSEERKLIHLYDPKGISIDNDGTLYIADCANKRVMKWRKDAQSGERIEGLDQLDILSDVLVDSQSGALLVCDLRGSGIIRLLQHGANSHQREVIVGGGGGGATRVEGSMSIALDSVGNLYVLEFFNNRVLMFSRIRS